MQDENHPSPSGLALRLGGRVGTFALRVQFDFGRMPKLDILPSGRPALSHSRWA